MRIALLRLFLQAGPQGLSNTAWSFAAREVLHVALFEAVCAVVFFLTFEYGQQELGNTAWAFAELRAMGPPPSRAAHWVATPSANDAGLDVEEVSRGAYALAWAQGRLSLGDHARILVAGHMANGRCNRLS